jgi:hypothetical protein
MLTRSAASTAAILASACFFVLILVPVADAATTASRTPQCIKVTDASILGGILNQKFPAWLFTDACNYAVSFYVQFPGTAAWTPSVKFNPGQVIGYLSSGKPASQVHVLECPSGYSAVGTNPNLCSK